MLIRITKSGPGCTYQPGALLKVPDKKAEYLIGIGFAQPAEEQWDATKNTVSQSVQRGQKTGNPYMQPPRYICGCGFVSTSKQGLAEHRNGCK